MKNRLKSPLHFLKLIVLITHSQGTVDQEIFMSKIIRVKIFCVDIFSRLVRSAKILLMVDSYSMNEYMEHS